MSSSEPFRLASPPCIDCTHPPALIPQDPHPPLLHGTQLRPTHTQLAPARPEDDCVITPVISHSSAEFIEGLVKVGGVCMCGGGGGVWVRLWMGVGGFGGQTCWPPHTCWAVTLSPSNCFELLPVPTFVLHPKNREAVLLVACTRAPPPSLPLGFPSGKQTAL